MGQMLRVVVGLIALAAAVIWGAEGIAFALGWLAVAAAGGAIPVGSARDQALGAAVVVGAVGYLGWRAGGGWLVAVAWPVLAGAMLAAVVVGVVRLVRRLRPN